MDEKRLNHILVELKYYDLSDLERRFVDTVKHFFQQEQRLTDQQESILEGLYREKIRWARIGVIRKKHSPRSMSLKVK
jgi:hypothetical protein